jgi:small GTP-binding protein
MIQKKVCMLGAFAVGKTSLVTRFVTSLFSDKYLTTVGVKINKKTVQVKDQDIDLLLWDIYGEDDFQKLRISYLRGASGYLLIVDGTRRSTLEKALQLQHSVEASLGQVPFVVVLNKADLTSEWEIDDPAIAGLAARGWTLIKGSAKTGLGVEEMFLTLVDKMLKP